MVGDGAVGHKRHGAIPLGNGGFRPCAACQALEKRTLNVEVRGSRSEAQGTTSAACGCPARLQG